MKQLLMLALVAFAFASCGDKYEFWDISHFKMDNQALEDDEEVIILYSSRGPDYNEEREYYVHLIVVSQKTGDTVNVLTTFINALTMEDKGKVYNFYNQDNVTSKVLQMDLKNLKDLKNMEDIKNQPTKNITKIARDPEFDFIADNDYPTIIGTIGVTKDDKKY